MIQPGRKYSATDGYRYGFNGKENDNEVKGEGNQQDYGFRIYDPRLGKFLSVDPLTIEYPWYTPYQFAGNKPVWAIDLDGLEEVTTSIFKLIFGSPQSSSKPRTALDYTTNATHDLLKYKTYAVSAFSAAFSDELAKKFISHYANENGREYKLTTTEVKNLNVRRTGIMGLVTPDYDKFKELTSNVGHRDKGKKHSISFSNHTIQGGADVAGTLGRFTIEIQGEIVYDKDDKSKWTFEGKMRFVDTYDFKTNPVTENDIQRHPWADVQVKLADKFLPGNPFNIRSDWINIKQTSSDPYFDWFNDKSQEIKQNRVSKELDIPANELGEKKSNSEFKKEQK